MIEELKKYILSKQLDERAIECFWVAFMNWKSVSHVEYEKKFTHVNLNDLKIFIHSIGVSSKEWPECIYNRIIITILIQHNNVSLGNYRVYFAIDSESDDDDFLEIY